MCMCLDVHMCMCVCECVHADLCVCECVCLRVYVRAYVYASLLFVLVCM